MELMEFVFVQVCFRAVLVKAIWLTFVSSTMTKKSQEPLENKLGLHREFLFYNIYVDQNTLEMIFLD